MERDHIMVRYIAAQECLEQAEEVLAEQLTPEQSQDHQRAVEASTWEGLLESVEQGWMSEADAIAMFYKWFKKDYTGGTSSGISS